MGGECNTHGKTRKIYTILFGEPQGKIILGNVGVQGMMILNQILNI
jgi:hypothetical protein